MPAVPRPGQPCVGPGGQLYRVARLDIEDERLVVGVQLAGAAWWEKVTSMSLTDWRRLFTWPDPPA